MSTPTARWRLFSVVLLLAAASWAWYTRVPSAEGARQIASPRQGFPAPDFALPTPGEQQVRLADLRGQVVIINLWASWCAPCRAEMPAIQRVYDANRHRGLEVLAVNSTSQDREAAAISFARELELTFPILLDRDGAVSRRYLLRALPTTFFVDRSGIIRSVIIGGPMSEAVLVSQVEALLQEPP
jgi:cytochrome c biogenesis protein CcmG, thiol:disulfide interchange protein DsbE